MKQKTNHNSTEEVNVEKRQTHFFQRLFCCASQQDNGAIANEVLRLCKLLLPQYKSHFTEIGTLAEEAHRYQYGTPSH